MNITMPTTITIPLDTVMQDAVTQHGIVAVMDAVVQVADNLNKTIALTARQRAAYLSAKTIIATRLPEVRAIDFN